MKERKDMLAAIPALPGYTVYAGESSDSPHGLWMIPVVAWAVKLYTEGDFDGAHGTATPIAADGMSYEDAVVQGPDGRVHSCSGAWDNLAEYKAYLDHVETQVPP